MLIETWFKEALGLKPGDSILIPVADKIEAKKLAKDFLKVKAHYMEITPVDSYRLRASVTFQGGLVFLKITKDGDSPGIGFKIVDGKSSKIEISFSGEDRLRTVMRRDGYSEAEINEYLAKTKE
jgi:hypothetical protein